MIDRWAADAAIGGADPKTIEGYRYSLLHFEKFLGRSITKADKMDIRAYVDMHRKKKLTTQTIRSRLNALSSFYNFLIFEGIKKDNPVQEVRTRYLNQYKTDSERHTHKLISVEEAARLVGYFLDIRDEAMVLLMLKTGVRRGELLSMEVQDIHWEDRSILLKEKKKRSNRIVFFDDETAYVLRRWLEVRETRTPASPALWISTWGKRIDYGSLQYNIEKAALACGLHDPASSRMEDHFSAHCCRHWFTTHLLRAGMRREYVAFLRGDVSREAIDTYFHIDPADVRRAYLAHIPQ
ncbi:MAG: tyrosine-type recombinase/integrase, partial [Methanothrix sp.]